jgi:hypothetical protein
MTSPHSLLRMGGWLTVLVSIVQVGCRGPTPGSPVPASEEAPQAISGTVTQELAAGGYTYFLLRGVDGADRWVVVADRHHRGARHLSVDGCRRRRDFTSRRLNRQFAVLDFCSIAKTQMPGGAS